MSKSRPAGLRGIGAESVFPTGGETLDVNPAPIVGLYGDMMGFWGDMMGLYGDMMGILGT